MNLFYWRDLQLWGWLLLLDVAATKVMKIHVVVAPGELTAQLHRW